MTGPFPELGMAKSLCLCSPLTANRTELLLPAIRKKASRDIAGSIKVVEMRPSQNTSRLKRNSSLKRTVSEIVHIPPLDDTWEIPQSGCCEAGKAHVNVVCLILGKAFFRRKASLDSIYLESFV